MGVVMQGGCGDLGQMSCGCGHTGQMKCGCGHTGQMSYGCCRICSCRVRQMTTDRL